MAINGYVISGLDPGAVPGASTTSFFWTKSLVLKDFEGAK